MGIEFTDTSMLDNLEAIKPRLKPAIKALAEEEAVELESYMKRNRPWTDRTGAAKARLSATVSQPSEWVTRITLAHGVTYGKWLELANSQKYAIVKPTVKNKGKEVLGRFSDFMKKVLQ